MPGVPPPVTVDTALGLAGSGSRGRTAWLTSKNGRGIKAQGPKRARAQGSMDLSSSLLSCSLPVIIMHGVAKTVSSVHELGSLQDFKNITLY
eukprot:SAG11_NODE_291_length_11180_cov_102.040155_2_plen_92_part_00